jgi:hypothetical protein
VVVIDQPFDLNPGCGEVECSIISEGTAQHAGPAPGAPGFIGGDQPAGFIGSNAQYL